MNYLTSILSSLLLSCGFSGLAARFDRSGKAAAGNLSAVKDRAAAANCAYPCRWQQV